MILLGLMMAVMTGSIRFAGQSRDAVTARVDSLDNMRIAQDFLRQTIAQAHPKRWLKVVGRPYVFRGERDEISMAAPLTARVGVGGLFLVKFSLVDGDRDKGKKLVMARQFPGSGHAGDARLRQRRHDCAGREHRPRSNSATSDATIRTATRRGATTGRSRHECRRRSASGSRRLTGTQWPEMIMPLRVVPRPRVTRAP